MVVYFMQCIVNLYHHLIMETAAAQQELVISETTVQSLVMMVMRYKVMG